MAQQGERVKVYRLNDEGKWGDKGTGHVSVEYLERSEAVGLVVIDEEDNATSLLIHRISSDDVYRRQEDTIISWRDPEAATDLALSFQESLGCTFIWDHILNVQRTIQLPPVGGIEGGPRPIYSDFEHSGTSQDEGGSVDILELPSPELANLPQIVKVIAEVRPFERDRVSSLIVHERTYIQKIAELFRLCEDLDNTEGLHMLYKIVKGLILLNDGQIFDVIFSDEYIMDIVGALEYDPELPTRQEHRSFLKVVVVYKEAVPIYDSTTLSKIHQTYRIGYIKDVILPRVLDDQTFGTLNSIIVFNNISVVTALQGNNEFLGELFQKLRSADTHVHIKKELILFVQEFVTLSKHLQPPKRTRLLGSLVQKGLFDIVTDALQSSDEGVKLSGSDILIVVLCHEPILLRVFLVEQPDHQLFSLLVKGMLTHGEGGLQAQLLEVMRMLLDSDTMDSQSEKSTFLDVFYEKYMDQLVGALTEGCSSQVITDNYKKVSTAFGVGAKLGPFSPETSGNICELLCFCVQHHDFRIKYYIMRNNVVEKILLLTHRKEKYLVVAAVRFLRTCVGLKDDFYTRYLMKNNLFEPVIQAFLANGKRYNLLNSAVLELIDFIKKENIKSLVAHIVDTFGERLDKIDYVDTFQSLRLRHDQNLEGAQMTTRDGQASGATNDSVRTVIANSHSIMEARNRKDERALDKDEEDYFNEDSDEEDDTVSVKGATPSFPSQAVVVNGSALTAAVLFRGGSFGLVDYEDEEEDDAPLVSSNNKKAHPTKRPDNRVSVPAVSETAWSQEDDRSPKRRAMQEDGGSMKKQRAGNAQSDAQSEESEALVRDDVNMKAGTGREPENSESWRKVEGAVDGLDAGVTASERCEGLGTEGNLETASVVDRCEMANGGDSSPQCKTGCGKVADGTNIAHSAGVPNEGDFLREGVQRAQTSSG